jgi:hypothetical protein
VENVAGLCSLEFGEMEFGDGGAHKSVIAPKAGVFCT